MRRRRRRRLIWARIRFGSGALEADRRTDGTMQRGMPLSVDCVRRVRLVGARDFEEGQLKDRSGALKSGAESGLFGNTRHSI